MDQTRFDMEEINNFDLPPSNDTFDSLLENINRDSTFDNINEIIDEAPITADKIFYYQEDEIPLMQTENKTKNTQKFFDLIFFLLKLIDKVIRFIITISFICELVISFYSVIILNYVFFVSSIISYTMAPIYQVFSKDWLNAFFSIAQVILASPIIAFYILYIIKSVISLGEFFQDIPKYFTEVFYRHWQKFKNDFFTYFSMIKKKNYKPQFKYEEIKKEFSNFFKLYSFLLILIILEYVLLNIDKLIIILGALCYVCNTIQIIGLILPSYLYFFNTLANKKCKNVKYVEDLIKKSKEKMKEIKSDSDSDSEKSDESDSEKIIDDDFIKIKKDDDDNNNDNKKDKIAFQEIKAMILDLVLANNYFSLYNYSKSIAFDKHKQFRKRCFMYFFFVLNLIVICYDIYQLTQDFSAYFLVSVIIRFLFVPLLSFYNIFTISYHKSKDSTLKYVIIASTIFTVIIMISILACLIFVDVYQTKYRLKNLEFLPPSKNISIVNENIILHPICIYDLFNISAFDAFGYDLGGYDIKRNKTIFENQMKIFFGENYSNHISYKVYEVDKNFLFLKFYDSSIDTHIFAFRGYNSGPELAFQLELFVGHYVIPFFEDNVPLYETINDYWLSFYTDFFNSFGLRFFENKNMIVKYVKSIMDIYENEKLDNHERVIFSGINCGGVIAKIVGTLLHRKSISFLSFPMNVDFIQHLFEFSTPYIGYITNIFNVDGLFSHPDSNYALNIGIDAPIFKKKFLCTSDYCYRYAKTDNVYQSFCTMSEMCGKGNQFNYYCENAIGQKFIDIIRDSLKDD